MERWNGRVALVTGASSGIGAAICESLVKNGMKVVGAARRVERVKELSEKLISEKGELMAIKCDVADDSDVYAMFKAITNDYGGVDICVNNAGMSYSSGLLDGTPEEWRYASDVNVISLCLCTKLAVASMRERGVDDGHIINISSTAAYRINPIPATHFYSATKHAVRALTEGVRQELRAQNSHIRVSSLSPGLVKTEIIGNSIGEELSQRFFEKNPFMLPEDMASSVLFMISSPSHVEINDIFVVPTAQKHQITITGVKK